MNKINSMNEIQYDLLKMILWDLLVMQQVLYEESKK